MINKKYFIIRKWKVKKAVNKRGRINQYNCCYGDLFFTYIGRYNFLDVIDILLQLSVVPAVKECKIKRYHTFYSILCMIDSIVSLDYDG